MRTGLVLGMLVVLASFGVQPAGAKAEILPGEGVVYFTNKLVSDTAVTGPLGARTYEATDVEPTGAASQKAYANVGAVAAALETAFHWKATQEFEIEGDVTAHFWVSCDVATVYRGAQAATYRFTFQKNGATVGTPTSVTDATPQVCTGPTSIREVVVKVTIPGTKWKVGDTIGASLGFWVVSPPQDAVKNFHYLVGSATHPSHMRAVGLPSLLPVANVSAPVVTYQNATLEGATAEISKSFDNATNAVHTYNWSTDASQFVIGASADVGNGSLSVEAVDGAGSVVYNMTFDAASSAEEFEPPVLVNATAGDWVIRLTFVDFVGSIDLTIGKAPSSAPNETASPAAPPSTEAGSENGAPGPGAVFVAVGLLAVVVMRRRAVR